MDALPHTLAQVPLGATLRALTALLNTGLANAVAAGALALLLLPAARLLRRLRRPALAHALALLVLVKLVTPAAVVLPVAWPAARTPAPAPAPAPAVVTVVAAPPKVEEFPAREGLRVGSMVTPVPIVAGEAHELPRDTASTAQVPLAAPVPPVTAAAAGPTGIGRALRLNWRLLLGTAWAAGSLTCALIVAGRLRALRRLVRLAEPAPAGVQEEADALALRLGLPAAPPVWFLPVDVTPMLVGVFARPRLLVPQRLWERLDPSQRHTLLLHELAHLRRRDHWVRYLELLTAVLYWWHPAAWWARSALHEAEEQCCDAWVVWALPGAARTYMTTLLAAVDFLTDTPRGGSSGGASDRSLPARAATHVLASGMGQFHCLQRRLKMVREHNVQRRLTGAALAAVLAAAAALPLAPRLVRGQPEAANPGPDRPAAAKAVVGGVSAVDAGTGDTGGAAPPAAAATDPKEPGTANAGAAKANHSTAEALRALLQDVTGARARAERARAQEAMAERARADAERARAEAAKSALEDAAKARADEARALASQREESARVADNYAKEADELKAMVGKLQAELAQSRAELDHYRKMLNEHPERLTQDRPGGAADVQAPKAYKPVKEPSAAVGGPPPQPTSAAKPAMVPPAPKIALRYVDGRLEATDADSGRTVWVYQASPEVRLLVGGPDGTIILRQPDHAVIFLDPATGKQVQHRPAGGVIATPPGDNPYGAKVPDGNSAPGGNKTPDGAAGRDRLAELEARVDKLARAVEQLSDSVRLQGQPGQPK